MGDRSLLIERVRRFVRSNNETCPGEVVPSPLMVVEGESKLPVLTASASMEPLQMPRESTCASANAKSPAKASMISEISPGTLQSSMAWLSLRRQTTFHCSWS